MDGRDENRFSETDILRTDHCDLGTASGVTTL